MSLFFFLFLGLGLGFPNSIASIQEISVVCPLDIDTLRKLIAQNYRSWPMHDSATECRYAAQGINMLRSEYLRTTEYFSLPQNVSEVCWNLYKSTVNEFIPRLKFGSVCGFNSSLFSKNCMNVTNRSEFEGLISGFELEDIKSSCDQPLQNKSLCGWCVDRLLSVQRAHFHGPNLGNTSNCDGYPFMYAAAFANRFGPDDIWTAKCLFLVDFTAPTAKSKNHKEVVLGILSGCFYGVIGASVIVWFLWVWHNKRKLMKKENLAQIESPPLPGIEIVGGNKSLLRFTFEEVRKATGNFSRDNIIGTGGYGNVYKGVLEDGSEVAFKRFKNCSTAWDNIFAHEVEVIASVKHVNLLALRGYCTLTLPLEGHQRIIVCELMQNGSLYDHLFGSGEKKLSWLNRRKIALGMARGLAYLHYGVQPGIIHRDIKASNVLVDEAFEPKLADFGLAKFTPEGLSHLSTRVAGTLGYVAPEYALYGQLSERSDVYSFGVVFLELLSGKKAVISTENSETLLLTDWAWSLVKEDRLLDVVDETMPDLSLPNEMEKYVLIAVLCSHPVAYARPTMDHIVKMLESDLPVPSIPDRPFPLFVQSDHDRRDH